jgi:hypothetical protein
MPEDEVKVKESYASQYLKVVYSIDEILPEPFI